jgi:hypothetical protein
MNRYNFNQYQNQEEAYANGFALSMGTELGVKASQDMIDEMSQYSHLHFVRNKKNRKKSK